MNVRNNAEIKKKRGARREIGDPTEIANAFNIYLAHIGKNLSSKIEQEDANVCKQYLNSPTAETLQFKCRIYH